MSSTYIYKAEGKHRTRYRVEVKRWDKERKKTIKTYVGSARTEEEGRRIANYFIETGLKVKIKSGPYGPQTVRRAVTTRPKSQKPSVEAGRPTSDRIEMMKRVWMRTA